MVLFPLSSYSSRSVGNNNSKSYRTFCLQTAFIITHVWILSQLTCESLLSWETFQNYLGSYSLWLLTCQALSMRDETSGSSPIRELSLGTHSAPSPAIQMTPLE